MKGREDKVRFVQAFNRLGIALKCHFPDAKARAESQQVYFDSLEDLSIEAVEHGERTLRIEGTTDNWFPSTPEWFDAAAEWEAQELERPIAGLLVAAPEVIEEELEATRQARDLFIETCHEKGYTWVAGLIEAMDVRHPSEDPEAPWCVHCGDSGMRAQGDGAGPCECIQKNPRMRAAALRHQRLRRFQRRHERTAALQPARHGQKTFSQVADL
jgi:hypothetical protein